METIFLQDPDSHMTLIPAIAVRLFPMRHNAKRVFMKRSLVLLTTLIMFGCGYGSNYKSMTGTTTSNGRVTISELTPNDIMHGAGSFSLTINGSGFGSDAVVFFNGVAQATTFISASQVMAAIPADSVTNTANISVYVRTGGTNSNAMDFVVQ